jgi:type II secretory pathway pseudopilin PulG
MPSTRLHTKTHRTGEKGFSLAEAIVSAGLLTVSSVALISVFNSSIESVKKISNRDAISTAINADLAKVQRLNDYYSCFSGNCSVTSLAQSPPDKYYYAPSPTEKSEDFETFKMLCKNTPTNLSQGLVDVLGASTIITPNITRIAKLHPNNDSSSHLYIVEWSPPEGTKTQIILSPTVSQWCP